MKKIFIYALALLLLSNSANAYFIIDIPEGVLHAVNVANEKLVYIEKKYQDYQRYKYMLKTGITGTETFKMFKEIQRAYNTGKQALEEIKNAQEISIFHTFYQILNQAEILSYIEISHHAEDQIGTKLGGGNDTAIIYEKDSQNEQIAKNNIATVYARAIKTRYATQVASDEFKEEDTTFENETELLNAIRAVAQKTIERKANVLFLESSLLEYSGTEVLRSMPAGHISESKLTPQKIINSYDKQREQSDEDQ